MREKKIRSWRVMQVEGDRGVVIYCDPYTEHVRLYEGPSEELHLEVDRIAGEPFSAHGDPEGTQLSLLDPLPSFTPSDDKVEG